MYFFMSTAPNTVQCKINGRNLWCNYNDNNYKMDSFIDKRNKNKILVKYQNWHIFGFINLGRLTYHCKLEVKSDRINNLMNRSWLIEILKILNMMLPSVSRSQLKKPEPTIALKIYIQWKHCNCQHMLLYQSFHCRGRYRF